MTDPKVLDVIHEAISEFDDASCVASSLAPAIIGALSVAGFAIVQVDPDTVRRVVSEMYKKVGGV